MLAAAAARAAVTASRGGEGSLREVAEGPTTTPGSRRPTRSPGWGRRTAARCCGARSSARRAVPRRSWPPGPAGARRPLRVPARARGPRERAARGEDALLQAARGVPAPRGRHPARRDGRRSARPARARARGPGPRRRGARPAPGRLTRLPLAPVRAAPVGEPVEQDLDGRAPVERLELLADGADLLDRRRRLSAAEAARRIPSASTSAEAARGASGAAPAASRAQAAGEAGRRGAGGERRRGRAGGRRRRRFRRPPWPSRARLGSVARRVRSCAIVALS